MGKTDTRTSFGKTIKGLSISVLQQVQLPAILATQVAFPEIFHRVLARVVAIFLKNDINEFNNLHVLIRLIKKCRMCGYSRNYKQLGGFGNPAILQAYFKGPAGNSFSK